MKRLLACALAVIAGLALAGPFCFHIITETDIGWHLAVGRLIAHGSIPRENALAWTALHEPWYATSWLYDWLAFRLTSGWGVTGLQSLTFALLALTLVGLALACSRIDPRRGLWWVPAGALLAIPRITERPHMVTWVFLAFVLWLCVPAADEPVDFRERSALGLGWRRRLACVPLIALASNLHSGAVLPAAALGFFCLEAAWVPRHRVRELAVAAAGTLALLANPGGLFDLRYLVEHLHLGDVVKVVEMQPPTLAGAPAVFVSFALLLLAGWRLRTRSPALILTAGAFALLTLRAVRFGVEIEIVTVVVLAQALATFRLSLFRSAAPLLAAGLALVSVSGKYRSLRTGHAFDESALPVRAAQFIRDERIAGPMYNAFRDGGYLEWAVPEAQWFQDGRIQAYPESFFIGERAADLSAEAFQHWLDGLEVEWAVTSRWPEWMTGRMRLDSPRWALVYWDDATEIRVRRDVPRFASLIARDEYRHFSPNAAVDVATTDARSLAEWETELRRFEQTSPDYPLAAVLHCAAATRLGGEAGPICDRAAKLADSDQLRNAAAEVRKLPRAH